MSTVVLSSVAAVLPQVGEDVVDVLFGATKADRLSNGTIELTVGSVPLEYDVAPTGGILALYGFKDRKDELQRLRRESIARNYIFHVAEIEVDVGEIHPSMLDLDSVRTARFANVQRMTVQLQSYIFEKFVAYSKRKNGAVDPHLDRITGIATRPDLWARLLDEEKEFKHLECVVIPVKESKGVRMVAYLRNNFKYVGISQASDGITMVLPKGVGKKARVQANAA